MTNKKLVELKDLEKVIERWSSILLDDYILQEPSAPNEWEKEIPVCIRGAVTESTAPLLRKIEVLENKLQDAESNYQQQYMTTLDIRRHLGVESKLNQKLQSQIAVMREALKEILTNKSLSDLGIDNLCRAALTTDGSELGERLKQAELKVESAIGILMKHGFTNAAAEIIEHTPQIAEKFKQLEQLSTSLDLLVKAKDSVGKLQIMKNTHQPRKLDAALTWRENDELTDNFAKETLTLIETFLKECGK